MDASSYKCTIWLIIRRCIIQKIIILYMITIKNENDLDIFPSRLKDYNWNKKQIISQTSFGTVYKVPVQNTKPTQYVAIRKFKLPKITAVFESLMAEIQKLKKIKSEYLVEYLDSQIDQQGGYIVMELCQCDLSSYLSQYEWKMPDEVSQTILGHMVEALSVLQKNNFYSIYINPRNFLLKGRVVKLNPIGVGKYQIDFKDSSISSLPLYMAPQVIFNQDFISLQNNSKAQIWSIGVIAYQLIVGSLPFSYHSWQTYKDRVMQQQLKIPQKIKTSQQMKDFILRCLVKQKNQRIGWSMLIEHPIIQKIKRPIPKKLTPQMVSIWKEFKLTKQQFQQSILRELDQQEQKFLVLNLQRFQKRCLQKYPNMSHKEIVQIFREYDKNNNNKFEVDELIDIFKIFKIEEDNQYVFMRELADNIKKKNINVYKISQNFDTNKNKDIDFSEMKNMILSILPDSSQAMINKVWNHLKEIHNGKITTSDMLQELLRYLPMQQAQLKTRAELSFLKFKQSILQQKSQLHNLFTYFDTNHNKQISLSQFIVMFNSLVGFKREEELKIVFGMIDKNKSGYIDTQELMQLIL